MPVSCSKDSKGCYCQWGSQKRYYYACGDKSAKGKAYAKAAAQGKAIRSSGYKDGMYLPERIIAELIKEEYLIGSDVREEDVPEVRRILNDDFDIQLQI